MKPHEYWLLLSGVYIAPYVGIEFAMPASGITLIIGLAVMYAARHKRKERK